MSVNNGIATVEFEGVGPSVTSLVSQYLCRLDRLDANNNFIAIVRAEESCGTPSPGILSWLHN